jgi:hypothetical protein
MSVKRELPSRSRRVQSDDGSGARASTCPAGDQWFPGNEVVVGGSTPTPFMPTLSQSQMVFAGIATNSMPFVGASAWAGFWPGGTVLPDSYGASSAAYLVP